MHWSGDRATLTLTHLNKEDEGLYTLRVTTKSGYETYSAYIFVRGECHAGWNLICEITSIATLCFRKHFENVIGISSDDTARTSVPDEGMVLVVMTVKFYSTILIYMLRQVIAYSIL